MPQINKDLQKGHLVGHTVSFHVVTSILSGDLELYTGYCASSAKIREDRQCGEDILYHMGIAVTHIVYTH